MPLAGAFVLASCHAFEPNADGTVSVQGSTTLGTWTRNVDDCEKADGITLLDQGIAVVAVANDPVAGNSMELPNPNGGPPVQVFAANCRTLEVDTYFNGVTVTNDSVVDDQEINGSVSADCDLPDGGTVTANATFSNCL
jgi:hypothetical protein